MTIPQVIEPQTKYGTSKLQWYSIIISYFKNERWVIEEAVIEPTLSLAYLAYNRFLNHYGRGVTTCKTNIYAQYQRHIETIQQNIIEK